MTQRSGILVCVLYVPVQRPCSADPGNVECASWLPGFPSVV